MDRILRKNFRSLQIPLDATLLPDQRSNLNSIKRHYRMQYLYITTLTCSIPKLPAGPDGRLLYSELVYACPKKSGKTTFAAIFVITIILLFGGSYAEAICAANDYEQSVGRVFAAIKRIIECSPLLRGEAKITADKIMIAGATITAIPSNYASAAGANPVVTVFDELWAYSLAVR
jgi:Terminase large subunit, ATPase domain